MCMRPLLWSGLFLPYCPCAAGLDAGSMLSKGTVLEPRFSGLAAGPH